MRPSVAAPCQTSSAENACTWIPGTASHGAHDARVVVARVRRMDPALEADLRRAALPGLLDAADDLVDGTRYGAPRRTRRASPSRRRRSRSGSSRRSCTGCSWSRRTTRPPQTSRRSSSAAAQTRAASSPRASRSRVISSTELDAGQGERRSIAAHDERHADRLAGCPGIVAGEAARVGGRSDAADGGIEPAVALRDVLGIDREPRRGARALCCGWPSSSRSISGQGASGFTWSMVTGDFAAPVVDPPRRADVGSRRRRGSAAPALPRGAEQDCATAIVHRCSSSEGSGWDAIRVPGLARKFWTMTSWTCPCSSPSAFRASQCASIPLPASRRRSR